MFVSFLKLRFLKLFKSFLKLRFNCELFKVIKIFKVVKQKISIRFIYLFNC